MSFPSNTPSRFVVLDTGFERYSLALIESTGGGAPALAGSFLSSSGEKASTRLHGELGRLMEKSGWTAHSFGGIVVNVGPGSFTGLRVGIAAAKGLARALEIPIYAADSLSALADGAAARNPDPARRILAIVDVRKSMVTARLFERQGSEAGQTEILPAGPEITETPQGIWDRLELKGDEPPTLIGDGAMRYSEFWKSQWGDEAILLPHPEIQLAEILGRRAILDMATGRMQPTAMDELQPRYARKAEVEFRPA